jgi:3-deoxy-D-manno-octulosonic-acid transferase
MRIVFLIYGWLWGLAIPFLRRNQRLRQGFDQRTLDKLPAPAELWIQAASVGESFLAAELLKGLDPPAPLRILLTTCTSQGMEILEKCRRDAMEHNRRLIIDTAYLPFDRPALMEKALTAVAPWLMLLLESELWPGLLRACKRQDVKILVANGRMTARSLKRYHIWPGLWRYLRPNRILAISPGDAARFADLFGGEGVETVANIKFDRIANQASPTQPDNPLAPIFPTDTRLIILGSIREGEEEDVAQMIRAILDGSLANTQPVIIALFPRHMHRISHWQTILENLGYQWYLRSRITGPVTASSIVLWDSMGEMLFAYELARAAFVGGSLKPLGGQNFLEPLAAGLKPVIGPHWSNFAWIGADIIHQKLVLQARDWRQAAEMLLMHSTVTPRRGQTRGEIVAYVEQRRGGTARTCAIINQLLGPSPPSLQQTRPSP